MHARFCVVIMCAYMQISVNEQCANWNVSATCEISYKVKDYLP